MAEEDKVCLRLKIKLFELLHPHDNKIAEIARNLIVHKAAKEKWLPANMIAKYYGITESQFDNIVNNMNHVKKLEKEQQANDEPISFVNLFDQSIKLTNHDE
ncbi:MAG: hypothetical protein ACRC80_29400 [Waterburya sp.]